MVGKIRSWPKGVNFSNMFCQIYIQINDETLLFNGYMSDTDVSSMNILLAPHWENIQLIQMTSHDPRKVAQEDLDRWAKEHKLTAYKKAMIYLTQLKLELLDYKKENKKSYKVNELETEI